MQDHHSENLSRAASLTGETGFVIVGAGGFGRGVADIVRDTAQRYGHTFLGAFDDGEVDRHLLERLHIPFLGYSDNARELPSGTRFVVPISNAGARRTLDAKLREYGLEPFALIDNDTSIGTGVEIGPGAIVCAGTRVRPNAHLGAHVHLNGNVSVGHDAVIDAYSSVFPLSAIGGFAHLEEDVTIGAVSAINPSVTIGRGAYIGSGAAVVSDVPAHTLAAGVPAKVKKTI